MLEKGYLYGLGAILLWSTQALISTQITHIPSALLTGLALMLGSLPAWRHYKRWNWSFQAIFWGTLSISVYHYFYFLAFRYAPAASISLINSLWPLLLTGISFFWRPAEAKKTFVLSKMIGIVLGFSGVLFAISQKQSNADELASSLPSYPLSYVGYGLALACAFIWAAYSFYRANDSGDPVQAGLFCLLSGPSMFFLTWLNEPLPNAVPWLEWLFVLLLGLGPLGYSFVFWDKAVKLIGPFKVVPLSFVTPVLSLSLLAFFGVGGPLSAALAWGAVLVLVGLYLNVGLGADAK